MINLNSKKEMLEFVEKAYKEGNMPVWDYEKFKEELRESSAKEMFKELGYKLKSKDEEIIEYENENFIFYTICFCLEHKSIEIIPKRKVPKKDNKDAWTCEEKPHHFSRIDMELLKAINKQVEELGWNK